MPEETCSCITVFQGYSGSQRINQIWRMALSPQILEHCTGQYSVLKMLVKGFLMKYSGTVSMNS
jgi:hypothetical protein